MHTRYLAAILSLAFVAMSCSSLASPETAATSGQIVITVVVSPTSESPENTKEPVPPAATAASTGAAAVSHQMEPSTSPGQGKTVFDVESSGTAPEKRAPYGDSLKINRFERPFLQDMTYIPDMDVATYNVSSDSDWYYVSVELIGDNPNNPLGIDYGVEIDLDGDGFGDYIIWAQPPYSKDWTTENVRVYADKNHDTGGKFADRSDAPFNGDGYETLIFDGGAGGDDPDLAWVRIDAGRGATVQFAFKKSLAGSRFMLGVVSDAGLKDVGKMDYGDRFTDAEAGSPEKSEADYPLKALFAVDNVCREGIGFNLTGREPQGCPLATKPTKEPQACPPPPGCKIWDPVACVCNG